MTSTQSNNMNLEQIVQSYLESNPILKTNKTKELEIRFGTNPKVGKPLNRVDYENIIKHIQACGFVTDNNNGSNMLRITNEYIDKRTGVTKMSNIRTEIVGDDVIKEYCVHNSLQKIIDMPSYTMSKMKFTQKLFANDKNDNPIRPVDVEQYNFRASFQSEQDFNVHSNLAKNIVQIWNDSKKIFRLINRVRFHHKDYPIFIDISIVKSSRKKNRRMEPQYTIQESNIFNNSESYEVELEIDNNSVGPGSKFNEAKTLLQSIKNVVRIVMCGLQNTKYPITYSEQDQIINEYLSIIHGKEIPSYVSTKHFIGPSSYTLQIENISKIEDEDVNVPNVTKDYCVTDKADGERRLLFINSIGRIYMINTNMQVIFTGTNTKQEDLFNSLFDGEYIKYDKTGKYINLYACFDIYYLNGKDTRNIPFVMNVDGNTNFRLYHLQNSIQMLKYEPIIKTLDTQLRITVKSFYISNDDVSIFYCCSRILSNEEDELYEYNTDGIIFTPNLLNVGTNHKSERSPNYKVAWIYSFKWKPPKFNTIDFLVTVKKDASNQDEIHYIYQDGSNMIGINSSVKYKTLELRCGFDETKHGYLNPCEDIYQDNISNVNDKDDTSNYKPVKFVPTEPYDETAYICNILLKNIGGKDIMMSEEGEPFEENMIVEFQYIIDNDKGWNWVPLRVRYDKTTEFRNGLKNYGNAYHVANNNWRSIHYPIENSMLRSGEGLPNYFQNSDVYYNRKTHFSYTRSLRDFHNLYVKKHLISSVLNKGNTIIDYAVGKAGDISKWMKNKASFVFGIDISRDNIHNRLDGACARYINKYKENSNIFDALFVVGNSALNIKNGSAFNSEKDKNVSNAVFGVGPKDKLLIGKGIYKNFGKGSNGFDVGSCQFSLHYMFENKNTLHNFMRNINETIAVNGYFIATCYDGNAIFNLLQNKEKGESVILKENENKIFEIIKQYDETGFPSDENSLGYSINVFQETINKYFVEYLVNYNYLLQIMEDYGFVPLTNEEAQQHNLPFSSGLFTELYSQMSNEDYKYGKALNMSPNEKKISFLNRYMIFKKVRNVDAAAIMKLAMKNYDLDIKIPENEVASDEVNTTDKDETPILIKKKSNIKKTKKKMVIE